MTSVNPSTSSQSHTNCSLSVFFCTQDNFSPFWGKYPVYLYSFKLCNICKTVLPNLLDSLKKNIDSAGPDLSYGKGDILAMACGI